MPFSLALLLLILYIEYLAIKKQKKNEQKRRCEQSVEAEYTSSKITHK